MTDFVVVEPTSTRLVRNMRATLTDGSVLTGVVSLQPKPRNPRYDQYCIGMFVACHGWVNERLAGGIKDRTMPDGTYSMSVAEWWEKLPPKLWDKDPSEYTGYVVCRDIQDWRLVLAPHDTEKSGQVNIAGLMFLHKATVMEQLHSNVWSAPLVQYLESLLQQELDVLTQWAQSSVWEYAITAEDTQGNTITITHDSGYDSEQRACVAMMQDFQKYLGVENE